ncbi:MAG: hypothetical protein EB141_02390, partial [Verrucomicrobia bacterium]|nr:hypothetical protein [Verrucomicrobiota bacterium]
SKPEAVIYASSGAGSVVHISTALFESATGVKMLHVPYKGSTPGRVAVAAGEANLMFDGLLPTLPLTNSRRPTWPCVRQKRRVRNRVFPLRARWPVHRRPSQCVVPSPRPTRAQTQLLPRPPRPL